MYPWLIQWYSATGASGGTVWILLINALVFLALIKSDRARIYVYRIAALILIPVLISLFSFFTYEERGKEVEIVVVQPNIDPYSEKFVGLDDFIPFPEQIQRFIALTESGITPETDFVLWPETALDKWIQERNLFVDPDIRTIVEFKKKYPEINLITGLTSYTIFGEEKPSSTARYREDMGYYETYNTAFWIGEDGKKLTYHKSKLVPGVEIMPYPGLFNFLIDIIFDLGGTTGGYGKQDERTVFFDTDGHGAAPSICYESIYGDFMSEYIRNGAGIIFIITNDGWWGDTPGYKQHMTYARMRAIEGRRSIARSANTGISGFINQRGEIIESTEYWVQDVRNNKLRVNNEITFYASYGDYVARTASWLSAFLVLGLLARIIKKKR
jgi:apolipoprotein N-acyltransferase